MKLVLQSKLTKKLLLLFLLTGALIYLRNPTKVRALSSCCIAEYDACAAGCNPTLPSYPVCIEGCLREYASCLKDCG